VAITNPQPCCSALSVQTSTYLLHQPGFRIMQVFVISYKDFFDLC
jgi:hypothetical protein